MSPRQVALYAHRYLTGHGTGISTYVEEVVNALISLEGPAYRLCVSPEQPLRARAAPAGVTVSSPPVPRGVLHASWSLIRRPAVDRWAGRPGLIHVLYPSCPVPSRAPVVYTLHDLFPLRYPEWYGARERRMFSAAADDIARRAVAVVANSRYTAAQAQELLGIEPERLHVVPLGVPPVPTDIDPSVCARFGLTPGRYLVALGGSSPRKNIEVVLDALAASPGLRDTVLVVTGPPPPPSRGLTAARLRTTGWLGRGETAAILAGAAALVHPSKDEGFGLPVLEAMAAGVPVITSDAGALPETAGDAAILVPPADSSGWASAISRLLEDREGRSSLIDRGRRRAADFTWARTAFATAEIHMAVLDGP